jgi:pimeloyl-ACP methyl ester carboxylesterase
MQAAEKALLQQAGRFSIRAGGCVTQVYTWGNGPAVLFVHGWAGRGLQFYEFIRAFTAAGYRAVTFDAPAHGLSKGKQTSLVDFKDAIQVLNGEVGPFQAIIGHSLGGAAGLFALTQGVSAGKLVTISTPASDEEILREFAVRIGASSVHNTYLRAYVQRKWGMAFHQLMAPHFASVLPRPVEWLIFHDHHDKEVSIHSTDLLLKAWPQARVVLTSGLGHVRILRDEAVIRRCLAFVNGV